MNEVYETLNEAKEVCIEKMQKAKDADEFGRYIDGLVKVSNAMTDLEKMEKDKELEEKKFIDSKDWKDPKFLIPVIAPIITMIFGKIIDRRTLWKQTEAICNFEATNIFASSAGKGLTGSIRMFPIINNRGDH